MQRIGTQDGLFSGGDPATNTKGTVVTDDWLNAVQEELVNLLSGFGITLIPADNTQIIDAVLANLAMSTGNASQLFRAATAAQFDASSYVATTEFVRRALGNYSSRLVLSGNATLTAAALGGLAALASASTFTATLPLVSQSPAGSRLKLANQGSAAVTIARQGTDPLNYSSGADVGPSFILYPGDTIILESSGLAWFMSGGSRALGTASGQFGASLAASGYQKLPTGLIVQWGSLTTDASGAGIFTYPITFPTGLYRLFAMEYSQSVTAHAISSYSEGASSAGFKSSGSVACAISIFAIGK